MAFSRMFVLLALFVVLPLIVCGSQTDRSWKKNMPLANVNATASDGVSGARCYDYRLGNFIDSGLKFYSHDMGKLSKYILDQIIRARMSGNWLVQADMISGRSQGLDWQLLTNGDLFAPTSSHGCFLHNTETFIVIVRY